MSWLEDPRGTTANAEGASHEPMPFTYCRLASVLSRCAFLATEAGCRRACSRLGSRAKRLRNGMPRRGVRNAMRGAGRARRRAALVWRRALPWRLLEANRTLRAPGDRRRCCTGIPTVRRRFVGLWSWRRPTAFRVRRRSDRGPDATAAHCGLASRWPRRPTAWAGSAARGVGPTGRCRETPRR